MHRHRFAARLQTRSLEAIVLTQPAVGLLLFDRGGRARLLDDLTLEAARGLRDAIRGSSGA